MALTSERNELLTPNKYHIVLFSETIHLIPHLTNLVDIWMKYRQNSQFLPKIGCKRSLKGHFPIMGFLRTFDML